MKKIIQKLNNIRFLLSDAYIRDDKEKILEANTLVNDCIEDILSENHTDCEGCIHAMEEGDHFLCNRDENEGETICKRSASDYFVTGNTN